MLWLFYELVNYNYLIDVYVKVRIEKIVIFDFKIELFFYLFNKLFIILKRENLKFRDVCEMREMDSDRFWKLIWWVYF